MTTTPRPLPAPKRTARTMLTEARALRTGDHVRAFDEQVGTHLRTVACTTVLFDAGRPRTVLVDWVGDDLPPSSYDVQQVIDVVQWVTQ